MAVKALPTKGLGLVLVLALSASPAHSHTDAGEPMTSGRIAYASNADGDYEIFVMRADGSRVRQLTHNQVDDFGPSWAPDGRRIVFERERGEDGYEDLYIVDVAGGPARPWILSRSIDEGEPDWSPDGRWIAFRGNDAGDGADVVAVTLDRKRGRIVSSQSENSTNSDPAWSPDGASMALVESYEGSDLYVAKFCCSHGYRKEHLTGSGWGIHDVDWSPDASCIAYTQDAAGASELYTMRADGGEPRLVSKAVPSGTVGSWSPDGSQILFQANTAGSWDLYVMDADGDNVRRLTETADVDEAYAEWWGLPIEDAFTPECGAAAPAGSPVRDGATYAPLNAQD